MPGSSRLADRRRARDAARDARRVLFEDRAVAIAEAIFEARYGRPPADDSIDDQDRVIDLAENVAERFARGDFDLGTRAPAPAADDPSRRPDDPTRPMPAAGTTPPSLADMFGDDRARALLGFFAKATDVEEQGRKIEAIEDYLAGSVRERVKPFVPRSPDPVPDPDRGDDGDGRGGSA